MQNYSNYITGAKRKLQKAYRFLHVTAEFLQYNRSKQSHKSIKKTLLVDVYDDKNLSSSFLDMHCHCNTFSLLTGALCYWCPLSADWRGNKTHYCHLSHPSLNTVCEEQLLSHENRERTLPLQEDVVSWINCCCFSYLQNYATDVRWRRITCCRPK